nr:hypothetical protein [Zea mays]
MCTRPRSGMANLHNLGSPAFSLSVPPQSTYQKSSWQLHFNPPLFPGAYTYPFEKSSSTSRVAARQKHASLESLWRRSKPPHSTSESNHLPASYYYYLLGRRSFHCFGFLPLLRRCQTPSYLRTQICSLDPSPGSSFRPSSSISCCNLQRLDSRM